MLVAVDQLNGSRPRMGWEQPWMPPPEPRSRSRGGGGDLDRLPSRLREAVEPHADRLDVAKIADAYEFAESAHTGQKRASGESFIVHTTEVARILAELHLDTVSVVAGLIHDTVEDTPGRWRTCGPGSARRSPTWWTG
jgi:hypothetical protein